MILFYLFIWGSPFSIRPVISFGLPRHESLNSKIFVLFSLLHFLWQINKLNWNWKLIFYEPFSLIILDLITLRKRRNVVELVSQLFFAFYVLRNILSQLLIFKETVSHKSVISSLALTQLSCLKSHENASSRRLRPNFSALALVYARKRP